MIEKPAVSSVLDIPGLESKLEAGDLIFFGFGHDRADQVKFNLMHTAEGTLFIQTCREQPGNRDIYLDWHCEYTANQALYALLTGDVIAGRIAAKLTLKSVRKGMAAINVQGTHGLEVRDVLPRVALALNWCPEAFTDAERQEVVRQLKEWAEWVWPETNPARKDHWAVNNIGDNFYHGYMLGVTLAALALRPHLPQTAERLLDIVEQRWSDQVAPFLANEQVGAFPLEGAVYGVETMMRIWQYGDAAYHANRGPISDPGIKLRSAWHNDCYNALRHYATPDGQHHVPFGDAGGDHRDRLTPYPIAVALIAANHADSARRDAWNAWRAGVSPPQWAWLLWHHVLWNTTTTSVRSDTLGEKSYHAPGAGFVSRRTDWSSKADMLAVVAGRAGQNHSDLGQGGFALWCGEAAAWITGPSRIWAGSTLLRETIFHNVAAVPPYDQPEFDSRLKSHQGEAKIRRVWETDAHFGVDMQLESAYWYWKWVDDVDMSKNAHPALRAYRRRLCWVPQEKTLLVLDEIVPASKDTLVIEHHWLPPSFRVSPDGHRALGLLSDKVPVVLWTLMPSAARIAVENGALTTRALLPDQPELNLYRFLHAFHWGEGAHERPEPARDFTPGYLRVMLKSHEVYFGISKPTGGGEALTRIEMPYLYPSVPPSEGAGIEPDSPFRLPVVLPLCPGCATSVGKVHSWECVFQVCTQCGRRYIDCGCKTHDRIKAAWTGQIQAVKP